MTAKFHPRKKLKIKSIVTRLMNVHARKMQKVNRRLFLWSLTAVLAGFLFGFDTVVISGAEQTIQELCSLSPALHGLAMSAALWGTVLGSLIGA